MSCDTQTTFGYNKYQRESENKDDLGKIFTSNDVLYGAVGSVAESNLLKLFARNHKPKSADEDAVLEYMLEFRDWSEKRTGRTDYRVENNYLFALQGKVFKIMEMDVIRINEFWALGSGMFLAIAAFHLGSNTEDAVEVAKT